jgi:uncharacterized membrane protein
VPCCAAGLEGVIGILPVAQALLLAPVLVRLARETKFADLRQRRRGDESVRLALVAGAMLAFITVAIPMQLEKQWITLGWALLGAALAWLHRKVPHPGLVLWTAALEVASFARLALNPAVLGYHPRQGPRVLNWFLYAYLVAALAMFAAAWWLREAAQGRPGRSCRAWRPAARCCSSSCSTSRSPTSFRPARRSPRLPRWQRRLPE